MTIHGISWKPIMDEDRDEQEKVKTETENKLTNLLSELVETERKYVADLVQAGIA